MFEQVVELGLEGGIGFRGPIVLLQIEHQGHQGFGNIAPAELAEMALCVGLIAIAVKLGCGVGHGREPLGKSGRSCPYL